MGTDGRDVRHRTDEDGNTWLIDKDGNDVRDGSGSRVPGPPEAIPDPISGFTTYDTSRGHCGLCGRLTCRGECFK
jgi:hypothetical protein